MDMTTVLVLSLDEAREALIQFWADLLADRPRVVELLHAGKLVVPNLANAPAAEITSQYGELGLGKNLLTQDQRLSAVLIQVSDVAFVCVADRG
jgi:hypothetical protein